MCQITKVLYTGRTHTAGGRDGAAHSADGRLDIRLSPPGGPREVAGRNHRRILGAAALAIAAVQCAAMGAANAQPLPSNAAHAPVVQTDAGDPLGPLKHVDAGV